jgi:hypothetical protein
MSEHETPAEEARLNPFRARRVRIAQAGWGGYTGHFGTVEFLDGASVEPVSWPEQQRLGGLVLIVSMETGGGEDDAQIGPSAELVRTRGVPHSDALMAGIDVVVAAPDGSLKMASEMLNRDELEAVADRKGIAGLRDIAVAWKVRGRSINEMINAILEAQEKASLGNHAGDDAALADANAFNQR